MRSDPAGRSAAAGWPGRMPDPADCPRRDRECSLWPSVSGLCKMQHVRSTRQPSRKASSTPLPLHPYMGFDESAKWDEIFDIELPWKYSKSASFDSRHAQSGKVAIALSALCRSRFRQAAPQVSMRSTLSTVREAARAFPALARLVTCL